MGTLHVIASLFAAKLALAKALVLGTHGAPGPYAKPAYLERRLGYVLHRGAAAAKREKTRRRNIEKRRSKRA